MQDELVFRWINSPTQVGEIKFTFDGQKVFNLFLDYPEKLTKEEKALFDKENPGWAKHFRSLK